MVWDPDEQDRLEELEPLHYDVPLHLRTELWSWVSSALMPRGNYHVPTMETLLTALRVKKTFADDTTGIRFVRRAEVMFNWFAAHCAQPEGMLATVRAVLKHAPNRHRAEQMEQILVRGNSGYAVRADQRGLEFRVHPAAREQVERAVATSSEGVGQLLTKAWNAAYGLEPRPDDAWTAAFRATEAVLRPIIAPGSGASLNRMINDYEAKPEKWESCLEESRVTFDADKHTALDGRETVMTLARAVSYAQKSRHAEDESANSVEEARAAVTMAISIAALCEAGALRRVT